MQVIKKVTRDLFNCKASLCVWICYLCDKNGFGNSGESFPFLIESIFYLHQFVKPGTLVTLRPCRKLRKRKMCLCL